MIYPNFLYIGMPKAGSTWLFEALREHPDVFIPVAKDMQFFDEYYDRGLEWYFSLFTPTNNESAIGELSHNYYLSDKFAKRIHDALPDVRLIITLREPGDWAISEYNYTRIHRSNVDMSLLAHLTTYPWSEMLHYLRNLRYFYKRFPASHIYVTFFHDLKKDASGYNLDVYNFLEVDPEFSPSILSHHVNVGNKPRSRILLKSAYGGAQILRRLGLSNIVGYIKRHTITHRLLYNSKKPLDKELHEEEIIVIRRMCRKTYAELEALIGKPLPASWYKVLEQPVG